MTISDACGRDAAEGSSVAVEALSTVSVSLVPQKILREGAGGTELALLSQAWLQLWDLLCMQLLWTRVCLLIQWMEKIIC
jgi:hypothetical protein